MKLGPLLVAIIFIIAIGMAEENQIVGKDLFIEPGSPATLMYVSVGRDVEVGFVSGNRNADQTITVTLNNRNFNVTIPANSVMYPEISFPASAIGNMLNITVSQNGKVYQRVQLSPCLNPSQSLQLGNWIEGSNKYIDKNGTLKEEKTIHEATYYMTRDWPDGSPKSWYGKWDDLP
jgi:hypothetical protein